MQWDACVCIALSICNAMHVDNACQWCALSTCISMMSMCIFTYIYMRIFMCVIMYMYILIHISIHIHTYLSIYVFFSNFNFFYHLHFSPFLSLKLAPVLFLIPAVRIIPAVLTCVPYLGCVARSSGDDYITAGAAGGVKLWSLRGGYANGQVCPDPAS